MSIGDRFEYDTYDVEDENETFTPVGHWLETGDIDVTGYDINGIDISNGEILPSQEMYGEYNRHAAQRRKQDARMQRVQEPDKRPLVEEIFQSIPGQYDLLKEALSTKDPDIVQELFETKQVKGLTPEEGEALLALVPKTKQWDVVKRFINASTVRFPIVHPIRNTKPDDTLNPEDAPNPASSPIPENAPTSEDALNPGEEPSGTGLKGCLEKAAQGSSTEMQDRPHAKVARSRPVFKRVSGKRGPRD